jgi:hypothetical protein
MPRWKNAVITAMQENLNCDRQRVNFANMQFACFPNKLGFIHYKTGSVTPSNMLTFSTSSFTHISTNTRSVQLDIHMCTCSAKQSTTTSTEYVFSWSSFMLIPSFCNQQSARSHVKDAHLNLPRTTSSLRSEQPVPKLPELCHRHLASYTSTLQSSHIKFHCNLLQPLKWTKTKATKHSLPVRHTRSNKGSTLG